MTMTNDSPERALGMLLRKLKLPTFLAQHAEISSRAQREGWSFGQALLHLCEMEIEERGQRRIERLLTASELPTEKTISTLDRSQVARLCEGGSGNRPRPNGRLRRKTPSGHARLSSARVWSRKLPPKPVLRA